MKQVYSEGQELLFSSPILTSIVTFIGDDEGWARVRFSDGSCETVRPSNVYAIDMTAYALAALTYERELGSGDYAAIDNARQIMHHIEEVLDLVPRPLTETEAA